MNPNSHIPSMVCIFPLNHESVEVANLGNVHQRRGQEGTARRGVNDELCQKFIRKKIGGRKHCYMGKKLLPLDAKKTNLPYKQSCSRNHAT